MEYMKRYINEERSFDKATYLAVFSMLWAIAGIYGFVYEMIFYYFNGGRNYVYWRGGCFGPWITIYGIGSFLIYFLTYRFRKKPLLVFVLGGLGCGAFELLSGILLYYGLNGHRGWNYNTERWNFGNINGFICFRSVIIFCISSLVLVYLIIPLIFYLQQRINKNAFLILSFILGGLFVIDNIYNLAVAPNIPAFMTANTFYTNMGLHLV